LTELNENDEKASKFPLFFQPTNGCCVKKNSSREVRGSSLSIDVTPVTFWMIFTFELMDSSDFLNG
ncbi:hypothetical protein KIN20_030728, partial [Parelaphostrongylus tenuis]